MQTTATAVCGVCRRKWWFLPPSSNSIIIIFTIDGRTGRNTRTRRKNIDAGSTGRRI
ncbi:hypothetical protein Hanom_Chr15g01382721 [Helianthus anomalus]